MPIIIGVDLVIGFIDFLIVEDKKLRENRGLYNFNSYGRDNTPSHYRTGLREAEMVFLAGFES